MEQRVICLCFNMYVQVLIKAAVAGIFLYHNKTLYSEVIIRQKKIKEMGIDEFSDVSFRKLSLFHFSFVEIPRY